MSHKKHEMAVKLVVMYLRPKDIEAFERVYNKEHVPIAVAKLLGTTKISHPRRQPQGDYIGEANAVSVR